MRIASVDVCLDPGYLVLICTHIIINYLSINVISLWCRLRLLQPYKPPVTLLMDPN